MYKYVKIAEINSRLRIVYTNHVEPFLFALAFRSLLAWPYYRRRSLKQPVGNWRAIKPKTRSGLANKESANTCQEQPNVMNNRNNVELLSRTGFGKLRCDHPRAWRCSHFGVRATCESKIYLNYCVVKIVTHKQSAVSKQGQERACTFQRVCVTAFGAHLRVYAWSYINFKDTKVLQYMISENILKSIIKVKRVLQ
ncbi:Hypothetical_protein [Hexamita inflata]|uniref:Hypothetical_protein n=1 Tax=Hexamita inflata TaxID=28002 RepID=A0ABP1GZG9_9EUKA